MKRRSFLSGALASLFGGLAAMLDPLSRFRAYFMQFGFGPRKADALAKQMQRTAADFASFDNSRGVAIWNESEQRWAIKWLPLWRGKA